ncbi:hypothetical protein AWENTII_011806 [Aspergillus wentii]|nr:hypothetical protein MW887_006254 [Aspergillus wentii]
MVAHGARHLLFISRSGDSKPQAWSVLEELQAAGWDAQVLAVNIGDDTALENALTACSKTMPPIRGCIQGAMTRLDSTFETMTPSLFERCIKPKVQGSWNLHRALPLDIDFFIMLSSCAGIVGGRAQTNYNAGNAFQDALAHHRQSQGLQATTLDLGHMQGVGILAERTDGLFDRAVCTTFGKQVVSENESHALLEYYCRLVNLDNCAQTAVGLCTREQFVVDNIT